MNIQETVISRTYENKFGEFFITLKVKAEDISLEEREASRAACREGTLMEVAIEKFQPESVAGEHTYVIPKKKEETIYQRFKRACIDYSGEDYYIRLKKHLGVEHLKDLEKKHSESMIEDLLKCQTVFISLKMDGWEFPLVGGIGLTHQDNAFILWQRLFYDFNKPKNA